MSWQLGEVVQSKRLNGLQNSLLCCRSCIHLGHSWQKGCIERREKWLLWHSTELKLAAASHLHACRANCANYVWWIQRLPFPCLYRLGSHKQPWLPNTWTRSKRGSTVLWVIWDSMACAQLWRLCKEALFYLKQPWQVGYPKQPRWCQLLSDTFFLKNNNTPLTKCFRIWPID